MAKRVVGSRELKTRLGTYLNRVRTGETIIVTDRDEPVAELRPIGSDGQPRNIALEKLVAKGLVSLPTQRSPARFTAVRARGASAASAVTSDRRDRG